MSNAQNPTDLFIIGGGINGCGIARDAAGRGLSVTLAEMGDLASATSSASTKLFHGGLRYLEYYEFRLVREALRERETLLAAMPHISWPLRFILPHQKGMRPRWLLRLGLFMYDHLGGRKILPATRRINLRKDAAGQALQGRFTMGFEYSDCWVQDSRLVVLNARDAEARGAHILTRTKVISARREADLWRIETDQNGTMQTHFARALVNAAGPWVRDVIDDALNLPSTEGIRLVRGSHIITRRLFDDDRPFILQSPDNRVVFAIPYEQDFTLIGTTDVDHDGAPGAAICTDDEAEYLCNLASDYLAKPITLADVVWRYSGVRPLYDDGASSATAATRDYVLSLDADGPAVLHIFGGKITTYRRLAETALAKLGPYLPDHADKWTARAPMPGGDFPVADVARLQAKLMKDYPFLGKKWATRLFRAYGLEAWEVLGSAKSAADLGPNYGATLTGAEVAWLRAREYAQTSEDILWRRTRLGLHFTPEMTAKLTADMEAGT